MSDASKVNSYVAVGTPNTKASATKLVMYVALSPTPLTPTPRRGRATVRSRMGDGR